MLGLYIPGTNVKITSRAIGYNSDSEKNEKLVIIGKAGSTAETYAKNTGLLFHNVDDQLTHQTELKATCVKEGNVEYWHCDSCGQDFSNTQGTEVLDVTTVAKVAHRKVQVPRMLPARSLETGITIVVKIVAKNLQVTGMKIIQK